MKAAIINRYGEAYVLRYTDVQAPRIKPDQMLVRVHASSVNPVDWKIRKGLLKPLTGKQFPMILGFDVAGDVVAVGGRVTRFRPGDTIYARLDQLAGGAYAEYAAVSERVAALKPANMSYEQAAAVPLAGLTALQALRDRGQLKPGQKVLINGASGGVGTYAVQIAKVLGAAEVVGVCSAKNFDLVRDLGCDRTLDYSQQDFTQEDTRYDIVFDVIGNRSFADCRRVLQPQGFYITTQPYPQNFLRSFASALLPGPTYKVILLRSNSDDLTFLKTQIEAGKIHSVIDRTYPLAETAAAHAYSEAEHATGKIVITVE
ncbi:MAG: NAD(P)-dependent alcohol dehydrogenase [Cyanobacteria bacterium Co-bin13]|nr:NAD(P)-dependent alcohol dehydrogenase [Cyanobacteria bacterium Co-bin13]